MPAELLVFNDPEALGGALAGEIVDRYAASEGAFLLGCPAGRTPRTTYAALAARCPDPSRLVVVMMDQYLGAPAGSHYCCRGYARRELGVPLGLPDEQLWLPDTSDPGAYDERIADAGGINLFLLASGASDGHVAFLAPGSPRDGRTAVLTIAESTRRDNLVTFPEFSSLEEVPRQGASVGLGTIASARALRLALHGADKRAAARRLLALDGFDPDWPASIVHDHPDAQIWIDREALP